MNSQEIFLRRIRQAGQEESGRHFLYWLYDLYHVFCTDMSIKIFQSQYLKNPEFDWMCTCLIGHSSLPTGVATFYMADFFMLKPDMVPNGNGKITDTAQY